MNEPERATTSEKHEPSIDLLLERIERFSTADVKTAPSADLVTLEQGSNGLEILAEKNEVSPLALFQEEYYPLAPYDAKPAVPTARPADAMPLSIPERFDLDNYLDGHSDSDLENIHSFFGAHAAYKVAEEDLRAGRNEEAKRVLEQLLENHPGISEYKATLFLARFRMLTDPNDKLIEASKLVEHARDYRFCVTTQATLGRMYLELDRPHAAARFLRDAAELEPERSDILSDLRTANALLLERKKEAESADLDPLARERFPTKNKKAPESEREQHLKDVRSVPIALGVFALLAGVLFVASNVFRLGDKEVWLEPADVFFWVRQALVLTAGLVATFVVSRRRPIKLEEIAIAQVPLGAALMLGLFVGATAPLGVTKSSLIAVAAMTFVRVLAEEAFFRGYLGRVLQRGMVGSLTPIVLSAALYAAYQLTYVAIWNGDAPGAAALIRIGMAGVAGAAYALLHQKSESLSVALIAHVAAATAMLAGSIY